MKRSMHLRLPTRPLSVLPLTLLGLALTATGALGGSTLEERVARAVLSPPSRSFPGIPKNIVVLPFINLDLCGDKICGATSFSLKLQQELVNGLARRSDLTVTLEDMPNFPTIGPEIDRQDRDAWFERSGRFLQTVRFTNADAAVIGCYYREGDLIRVLAREVDLGTGKTLWTAGTTEPETVPHTPSAPAAEREVAVPVLSTGLKVGIAAGYSRLGFNPNLPRDLVNHTNHPDDTFLTGDPGRTNLDDVTANLVQLEVGMSYSLGRLDLLLSYSAKIPVADAGRSERQQINDQRPPKEGSFIYTELSDFGIGHVLRPGAGLRFPVTPLGDTPLELEIGVLLELGLWPMQFESGWSRYGSDEAELRTDALMFSLAPTGQVQLTTGNWSLYLEGSYVTSQLDFRHEKLDSSTGQGYEVGFGARWSIPLP